MTVDAPELDAPSDTITPEGSVTTQAREFVATVPEQ